MFNMCTKWFLESIIPAIVCFLFSEQIRSQGKGLAIVYFHVQQYLNILRPILYYCMLLLIISIFVY